MADIVSLLSTGSQLAAFDWSIVIECVSLESRCSKYSFSVRVVSLVWIMRVVLVYHL